MENPKEPETYTITFIHDQEFYESNERSTQEPIKENPTYIEEGD